VKNIFVAFLLIASAFVYSCKSSKKIQTIHTIQTAVSKKDTAQRIIIVEAPKVDSAAIVQGIMTKVIKNKIDFNTFKAKVNVDFESASDSKSVTAYISLKKDSVMFIKITHPIAGTVAQGIVTKDSVFLIIKKKVDRRAISYLQEVIEIPFDFSTLQDLIIGNPVFISNNIISYKAGDKQLQVFMMGELFKHLITLDNSDFKVLHSKLDDVDAFRNRTCDISFNGYQQNADNTWFATGRKITVSEKSKLNINLDFKKYSFNDPLNYIVTLPKISKRR
jgi:hypothetical protein